MKTLQDNLRELVEAGYPCVGLRTQEEDRALQLLAELGRKLGRRLYVWSSTEGWATDGNVVDLRTETLPLLPSDSTQPRKLTPADGLHELAEATATTDKPAFYVLKDLPSYLQDAHLVRRFLDLLRLPRPWTFFLVDPVLRLPDLLERHVTIVEVPLPDEQELRAILLERLGALLPSRGGRIEVDEDLVRSVVRASRGLTASQAERVFSKAAITDRTFDLTDLERVMEEKRQIIQKTGFLEYCRYAETLDHVGGLDLLKKWLQVRREAFTEAARAYGLPEPKGLFLLGVQGCGKSLVAKAVARSWQLPLLRLDIGSLFSKFIGQTESNLRTALRTAESIAPVVLWIDEIDKGFSGATGSGESDAGTSARIFGTFLTWLQEKTRPVFVVATANSIEHLPPEFLRKGRFDEIFFVDLPLPAERGEIFRIHLTKRKREPARYDLDVLAREADGFTGAEIEQAVVEGMYRAYPENREFTTADIREALGETVPLAQTQDERVRALRAWAKGRARWATRHETAAHGTD